MEKWLKYNLKSKDKIVLKGEFHSKQLTESNDSTAEIVS